RPDAADGRAATLRGGQGRAEAGVGACDSLVKPARHSPRRSVARRRLPRQTGTAEPAIGPRGGVVPPPRQPGTPELMARGISRRQFVITGAAAGLAAGTPLTAQAQAVRSKISNRVKPVV